MVYTYNTLNTVTKTLESADKRVNNAADKTSFKAASVAIRFFELPLHAAGRILKSITSLVGKCTSVKEYKLSRAYVSSVIRRISKMDTLKKNVGIKSFLSITTITDKNKNMVAYCSIHNDFKAERMQPFIKKLQNKKHNFKDITGYRVGFIALSKKERKFYCNADFRVDYDRKIDGIFSESSPFSVGKIFEAGCKIEGLFGRDIYLNNIIDAEKWEFKDLKN